MDLLTPLRLLTHIGWAVILRILNSDKMFDLYSFVMKKAVFGQAVLRAPKSTETKPKCISPYFHHSR
ncbi:unnamed protein product [Rhizophagus irregularis]|nr:unnamed protein product [Rhizophagus irregularis]